MKKWYTFITVLLAFSAVRAQQVPFDSVSYKHMEIGKIATKAGNWIIRVDHGTFQEDFFPVNLPEDMQIEGQEVAFEGALGRIPPNVRMVGTPIQLALIRKLYRTRVHDTGGNNENNNHTNIEFDSTGFIENSRGTIHLVNGQYVIRTEQMDGEHVYVPVYLPDDFKQDGITVIFNGVVGKTVPGVDMLGTPFRIRDMYLVAPMQTEPDTSELQEPIRQFYPFDSVGYLPSSQGIVKKVVSDPDTYIIEVDNGRGSYTHYLPELLPKEFRKDGLKVRVAGTIGKIPPNVRMIGTPLNLTQIEIIE